MKSFKKILVPTDFSAHSQEAVRTAADVAQKYGASIALVHVYEPVAYTLPEGYVLVTPQQLVDLNTEFDRRLAAAKKEAEAAGARTVTTELLQGPPPYEIVDFAERNAIDLIVMGTHGRTGIKHTLLGSIAERVLRKAPCPVLTVKADE